MGVVFVGIENGADTIHLIARGVALGWCAWLWRLAKFSGPGLMISVGYCDPGNWTTGLLAGAGWGYALLFVVLASSLIGMFLQSLSLRLGVAGRRDLAQACAQAGMPRPARLLLWASAEAAMVATDLAEVIGFAVGFTLLTGAPLAAGVALAAGDTLLLLLMPAGARHARVVEVITLLLMLTIAACFAAALVAAAPPARDVFAGFLPSAVLFQDGGATLVAVGILGATVMPHNLYLHSALAQQRVIDDEEEADGGRGAAGASPAAPPAAADAAATTAVASDAAAAVATTAAAVSAAAATSAPAATTATPASTATAAAAAAAATSDDQSPVITPRPALDVPTPTSPLEASFAVAGALDGRNLPQTADDSQCLVVAGDATAATFLPLKPPGIQLQAAPAFLPAGDATADAIIATAATPASPDLEGAPEQPPGILPARASARVAAHPRAAILETLALSTADSCISLAGALCINSAIVILAASTLQPLVAAGTATLADAASLMGAYELLAPALGAASATMFAVALLASGQSSTFTGTMAGAVVMEGFLNIRLRPWVRRLLTRSVAIVPAALTVGLAGEAAVGRLIVFSQVVLAFQLPFAIVPLVYLVSSRARLGVYAISRPAAALGWAIAALIIALNLFLLGQLAMGAGGSDDVR